MLRVIPKHKGTDHLQGDVKRRIKELSEELERPKKGGGRLARRSSSGSRATITFNWELVPLVQANAVVQEVWVQFESDCQLRTRPL